MSRIGICDKELPAQRRPIDERTTMVAMTKIAPLAFIASVLAAGVFCFAQERNYVRGFVTVPAEITEVRSRRVTHSDGEQHSTDVRAVVRYDFKGKRHEFQSQFSGLPRWRPGQSVMALVSPTAPGLGRVDRIDDVYPKSAALGALGLLCLVAFVLNRAFDRRGRGASTLPERTLDRGQA